MITRLLGKLPHGLARSRLHRFSVAFTSLSRDFPLGWTLARGIADAPAGAKQASPLSVTVMLRNL